MAERRTCAAALIWNDSATRISFTFTHGQPERAGSCLKLHRLLIVVDGLVLSLQSSVSKLLILRESPSSSQRGIDCVVDIYRRGLVGLTSCAQRRRHSSSSCYRPVPKLNNSGQVGNHSSLPRVVTILAVEFISKKR